jgi:hypothetical protein
VFAHKTNRSDFLCVIHKNKKGLRRIFAREISDIYTVGQEEPSQEIFNPQSRTYQNFIKRRI